MLRTLKIYVSAVSRVGLSIHVGSLQTVYILISVKKRLFDAVALVGVRDGCLTVENHVLVAYPCFLCTYWLPTTQHPQKTHLFKEFTRGGSIAVETVWYITHLG